MPTSPDAPPGLSVAKVREEGPNGSLAARSRGEVGLGKPIARGSSGVRKRLRAFDRLAPLGGGRLLDVGCGNGAYAIELATCFQRVDAIDVEPDRLGEFERHLADRPLTGHVDIQLMSAESLEFSDNSYDAVTAIEVLEHIPDMSKAAKELARVLKPGGILYVSVPNQLFPLETHLVVLPGGREVQGRFLPFLPYVKPLHERISTARNFTAGRLTELLMDAGLERTGLDHVMPPFDNWRFGRRWIKPFTERVETSPFGVFGVSIIATFRKPESSRATDRVDVGRHGREVDIAGVPLHDVTFTQAVDLIVRWAREGSGGYVYTPNVDDIVKARRFPDFRAAVLGARLRVPDGMGIVYGSRLLGTPLRGTVTGRLLPEATAHALGGAPPGIALFGGGPGVAEAAAQAIRAQGGLVTAALAPSYGFVIGSAEDADLVAQLRESGAGVVFVALGAPKQALWMARHTEDLSQSVLVGVGAAVDVLAGRVPVAPSWMTRVGLEWLFRLAHEPGRLARRYLLEDPPFFWWVARQRLGRS